MFLIILRYGQIHNGSCYNVNWKSKFSSVWRNLSVLGFNEEGALVNRFSNIKSWTKTLKTLTFALHISKKMPIHYKSLKHDRPLTHVTQGHNSVRLFPPCFNVSIKLSPVKGYPVSSGSRDEPWMMLQHILLTVSHFGTERPIVFIKEKQNVPVALLVTYLWLYCGHSWLITLLFSRRCI